MHKYSRRSKMKNDKMKKEEHLKLQLTEFAQPKPGGIKKAVEQVTKTFGDVSINDCANLPESRNRLKKSKRNVEAVKKEDTTWNSLDEDEYDYFKEENADGTVTMVRKLVPKTLQQQDPSSGKDYPADIWILISTYLRPEDVGRFAAICRTSYQVTCSAAFWYSLYRRHFRSNNTLPLQLTPKHIFRKYGIRTSVIRALFHLYPPFVKRLSLYHPHPQVLQRTRCVLAWQKTGSGSWFYYFKLEEAGNGSKHVRDLFEALEDVKANSEEGCRLLRIVSRNFYPIPPIERLFLASVDVRLSTTLTEQKVVLRFVSDLRYRKGHIDGGSGACVGLDQVTKINVFDWWDSRYPHTNSVKLVLD